MYSFWEQNSFMQADFVVVGSGITGLSTAISLKETSPKAKIIVLESGSLPSGASTKNAGFACIGSLTEILDDLQHASVHEVSELVAFRLKGLRLLRARLGDNNIGYLANGSYEMIQKQQVSALSQLDTINEMLLPILHRNAFSLRDDLINSFQFNTNAVEHLIENHAEGQIDTGLMMQSLIAYCRKLDIEIRTGTAVQSFEDYGDKVEVRTNQGYAIKCSKLAVCTNAFTKQLIPNLDIAPGRGQVLITEPIENLPFQGIFHFDAGYYYFRTYGNRVIFGGGRNIDFKRETSNEFELNEKIQNDLDEKLREVILPNHNFQVAHRWTGIMAFGSKNKQPIVEQISKNVAIGVRLGGMGIAIGSAIGEQLAGIVSTNG